MGDYVENSMKICYTVSALIFQCVIYGSFSRSQLVGYLEYFGLPSIPLHLIVPNNEFPWMLYPKWEQLHKWTPEEEQRLSNKENSISDFAIFLMAIYIFYTRVPYVLEKFVSKSIGIPFHAPAD